MVQTVTVNGKVILITGGYGYLGKSITESLIHHGAIVYVLARDEQKFEAAFTDIATENAHNLHFEQCDVTHTQEIIDAFRRVNAREGKIDVLINNAFYSRGQSPEQMKDEDWAYGIEGTLHSVFKCIREIIPYFKQQQQGRIISVSSMYGMVAPQFEVYEDFPQFLNPPHYGAAKAGIIQLTKYYASYLGSLGITVNAVTPGPFPSEEVKQNSKFVTLLEERTCLGRVGKPEDLAGVFVFLASDAANFITGQNIIVDGGWTSK